MTVGPGSAEESVGPEGGSLRVGFVSGREVIAADGGYHADVGLGRVLTQLLRRYPDLRVSGVDSGKVAERHSEELTLVPGAFFPLPPMPSFARGLPRTLAARRVLRDLEDACDVVVVQLGFQAPLALLSPRTPRVYHVVGDVLGMAQGSSRYRGAKQAVAVSTARVIDGVQRRLIRRPDARLVANGQELVDHYGTGTAVVSSSLTAGEVGSVSRARPEDARLRVLFVGYLRHEKGIDLLLDAVDRIGERVDFELELLGPGDLGDLGADIAPRLEALRAAGRATIVGSVPFGPDLFQHYADADLLVLPSRSEGTPRVLVEARAFGCPVLAAAVGGIPTSVADDVDGVLVPPNDAGALTAALEGLLGDEPRRRRLAAEGRRRAESRTVEAFTDVLIGQIEDVAPR